MAQGLLPASAALLLLLVTAQALRVDPPHGLRPELRPGSDAYFYKKDYPHDIKPTVKDSFKGPFPIVQDSASYDKDYTKDENSDDGEWKAQNEYDTLRLKLHKAKEAQQKAEAKENEEQDELEKAKDEQKELAEANEEERKELQKQMAEEKKKAAAGDSEDDAAVAKAMAEVERLKKECEERERRAQEAKDSASEGAEEAEEEETAGPEAEPKPKKLKTKKTVDPEVAHSRVQTKQKEYHAALRSYEEEVAELKKVEEEFAEAKARLKKHRRGGKDNDEEDLKPKNGAAAMSSFLAFALALGIAAVGL